ncbi:FAD-binding oxidoreductase [Sulfidibacter corallicola]|uniref:D-2-hydroxyglutarate dehydrogenase n=1 Tax=Sulfidibacter corallicola TaxID=2818388 RepID=A0A8A4TEH2_SULCO|nr:FAD-binding and (Fe-S)-binding domain-containing protein [Sulfidibacter corallicola]QTD48023.1 FAD-binding oxidoreductase [Sulfidibacter corallicola]
MIPRLHFQDTTDGLYTDFLREVAAGSDFQAEIRTDFSTRLVAATDNSIYQILPQAVIFPRSTGDVAALFTLADQERYRAITFSPRGGGTGTNGQSLASGIVVDCSKYMADILEIDVEAGWVRVQPGVVLDQLNETLKPTGLFFAPNLSPSNRATIGGMINTDACGKGSRIYGRTSNHVLEVSAVLADGTVWRSRPLEPEALARIIQREDGVGHIHRLIDRIVTEKRDLIRDQFPKLKRFLTGYNLAAVHDDQGRFNLTEILCGSEGSLAMITEARLKLTPIPKHKGLVLVKYPSFDHALGDAMDLLATEPSAIETIDDTILELARKDEIYHRVKDAIGDDPRVRNINLVEFSASTEEEVVAKLDAFRADATGDTRLGAFITRDPGEMAALWDLRKKGVGLLGNLPGNRKPIAFMEDTAVPPQNLADYIRELRALLTDYELTFGMFGHVDVGCLHVRPALDLQDRLDEKLIREISDKVVALVRKYGGVMWAEHGKGFRTEYTPLFFGDELYEDLRHIKAAFDPHHKMNPGKVVVPAGVDEETVKVEAPLRGQFDRQIPSALQSGFQNAVYCNGNGACFNVHHHHVMCPSSKVTRDRIHSPKGRATLVREWLRELGIAQRNPEETIPYTEAGDDHRRESIDLDHLKHPAGWWTKWRNTRAAKSGERDFSHELYQAMGGCLSCKACATQCPINVNIPDFKANFLELYHGRYLRPIRDYLVGYMETSLPIQSRFPALTNFAMGAGIAKKLSASVVGMVDAPSLSRPTLTQSMRRRGIRPLTPADAAALSDADKAKSVVLLQDAFTAFYDCPVFWATFDLLTHLGFRVHVAPFAENGKALHIKGFLPRFKKVAARNATMLKALAAEGVTLVGIEPSVALTYRDEYPKILGLAKLDFEVLLLQEFLEHHLDQVRTKAPTGARLRFALLGHCMEKTGAMSSQAQWRAVFEALGLELEILPAGCCGMAGVYGHETKNLEHSRGIFDMSWGLYFDGSEGAGAHILVTGYSCRTQTSRFTGTKPNHPSQALLKVLKG